MNLLSNSKKKKKRFLNVFKLFLKYWCEDLEKLGHNYEGRD